MHIIRYFIVVGSALLGLLFYANANLEPRAPLAIMTDFHGLPKPWRGPAFPRIAEADIPAFDIAPDMNWEGARPGAQLDAHAALIGQRDPSALSNDP